MTLMKELLRSYSNDVQEKRSTSNSARALEYAVTEHLKRIDTQNIKWEFYMFDTCHPATIASNIIAGPSEILVVMHLYYGIGDFDEVGDGTVYDAKAVYSPAGDWMGFLRGSQHTASLERLCESMMQW